MDRLSKAIEAATASLEKRWKQSGDGAQSESDKYLRRREVAETLSGSGLPSWPWCEFGSDRLRQLASRAGAIYSFCETWKRSAGSAFLSGPTGIGKTVCAVALGRRIIGRLAKDPPLPPDLAAWVRRVRFLSADAIVRSTLVHPLGRGEPPELDRAGSAGLLILDDLGNECGDRDNVLFRVLDRRYMASRPTIVTTHLGETELRQRYGDALVRRIVDHGAFVLPGGAT